MYRAHRTQLRFEDRHTNLLGEAGRRTAAAIPPAWLGSGVLLYPLFAACLILAGPRWQRGLDAQTAFQPTLSCSTRGADGTLLRTPLIRFTGALPPGDTLVLRVEWLAAQTGVNPDRIQVEASRADASTECASRRRLVVEMHGTWRSDAVVLRIFGSPAFELQGPNGRALRVPEQQELVAWGAAAQAAGAVTGEDPVDVARRWDVAQGRTLPPVPVDGAQLAHIARVRAAAEELNRLDVRAAGRPTAAEPG
jgi:hypothetical protein